MSSSRFARIREIYYAAFELDPDQRLSFVIDAARDDADLQREVLELLDYANDARTPLASAAESGREILRAAAELAASKDAAESAPPILQIAGYHLLRRIGEGGMGTVYEAEQETPRRRVALKVLRREVAGEEMLRRFRFEAESLGRLQHPSIAQVLEAGNDPAAGAWIAMEFVDGRTLDRWIADERPDRDRIIDLIRQISDGVQHAHQRGVIHRDLKPGNILVDSASRPKIIDFGIARVAGTSPEEGTKTRFGEVLGTLAYMSPEQAAGDPTLIDTRSDVWSLGVIAYQCLLGRMPFDLAGLGFREAILAVLEQPIRRPRAIDASIDGDLETILLTALERDRDRRYQSVAAFADDLAALRERRPIAAHPPSGWYQARMFARRHRLLLSSSLLILVSIIGGLVLSINYGLKADRSAAEARASSFRAGRSNYAAQIRAAAAAIEDARTSEAARILLETEPSFRGWEYAHLIARLDGSERLFGAPDAPLLNEVEFSTDGRLVIAAASGRIVAVSPDDGVESEIAEVPGIVDFDVSATALQIAVVSGDGIVRLIDLAAGAELARIDSGDVGARTLAFDPSGRRILVESARRRMLWTPADSTLMELPVRRGRICGWTSDGRQLIGIRDRNGSRFDLLLTDAENGFHAGELHTTTEQLRCVAASPDGSLFAAGTRHPSIHIIAAAGERLVRYLRAPYEDIESIVWVDDGRQFATGDAKGGVALWDREVERPIGYFVGHEAAIRAMAVDPAKRRLAVAGGGMVRVWRLDRSASESRAHSSYIWAAAFDPGGTMLASAAWDGTLRLFDGWTLDPLAILARGMDDGPRGMGWSRDGQSLHLASQRRVRSFSIPDGRLSGNPGTAPPSAEATLEDVAWPGRIEDPGNRVGPAGRHEVVAAEGERTGIRLRRLADGAERRLLGNVVATRWVFDSRERHLVVATRQGGLFVVSLESDEPPRELKGHMGEVFDFAFSPDGSRLATGGKDRTIRLWDTTDWSEAAALHGLDGDVRCLSFSQDGTRLVSGDSDRVLKIWSTVTARELVRRSDAARRRRQAPVKPASDGSAAQELGRDSPAEARSDAVRRLLEEQPLLVDVRERRPEEELTGGRDSEFAAALAIVDGTKGSALAIGIPGAPPLQTGAVEVHRLDLGGMILRLEGVARTSRFGAAVTSIGDLDGDNLRDLAIGAPGFDRPDDEDCGLIVMVSSATGREIARIPGLTGMKRLGLALWPAGDLDGDGRDDLLAASHQKGDDRSVHAISSARQALLWSVDAASSESDGLVVMPDRNGDGVSELLIVRTGFGLDVLSGASGRSIDPRPLRLDSAGVPLSIAAIDMRPESKDLVVAAFVQSGRRQVEVRRLGGKSDDAWRRRFGNAVNEISVRSIPDQDGDGVAEVIVRHPDPAAPYGGWSVTIVSGQSGATLESFNRGPDDEGRTGTIEYDPIGKRLFISNSNGPRPSVVSYPLLRSSSR